MSEGRGPQRRFAGPARRTNEVLRWVLVGAFLSGWFSFAAAAPVPATATRWIHAGFGLAVLVLAPWKTTLVRRVARTRGLRPTGVVLTALTVVSLVGGFWLLLAGWVSLLGLSAVQVHVGAAVLGAGLLVWHVVRHRRQRLRRTDLSRRALLRGGVAVAGAGAAYAGLGVVARHSGGPERVPTATGSRPLAAADIPATIWLLDRVPALGADHAVTIDGTRVTVTALLAQATPVRARLDCTSGWYADAEWAGVQLSAVLSGQRRTAARSLVITSVTGYSRRFPVSHADRLWLAVAARGHSFTAGTGAPLRLIAPGRRGFWWVKWVARVELSTRPSWLQSPFPPQ